MFKLVVISPSQTPATHCFDRNSIVIGAQNSTLADFTVAEDLLDRHVQILTQITENKPYYFIINLAQDPFVTLNDLPFGKRPLHDQDVIQLGNTSLRFELEEIQSPATAAAPVPQKKLELPKNKEEFTFSDIDALMQQVENIAAASPEKKDLSPPAAEMTAPTAALPATQITLATPEALAPPIAIPHAPVSEEANGALLPVETPSAAAESQAVINAPPPAEAESAAPSSTAHTPKLCLKDYYLSEYDEDHESNHPVREPVQKNTTDTVEKTYWSEGFKILASLVGVFSIIMSLAYLWISDQSGEAEIRAARSIADVTMALTYADIKHIHPQNQNWSDPEFINNTLTAVLAPEYPSLAQFDTHSQFASCPYMLRIYTSSNLAQFLVIAQPAPSLLQWMVPKATIIIDSSAMEMRKIKDLKALNRLLVNANMAEGTHSDEISGLVKQGELIPLTMLNDKKEKYGFAPPKALALIRPGAENLVYNAPRYYLLGQNLIGKAFELIEKPASNHEVAMFQQELTALADFPNLILYSPEGLQEALESQKALTLLAPKEKFLIAYLQHNAQGIITGAHLLMDDAPDEEVVGKQPLPQAESPSHSKPSQIAALATSVSFHPSTISLAEQFGIDQRDPLFIRLSALTTNRQQELQPISDEITSLLHAQTLAWQPSFAEHFLKLQAQYLKIDEEQLGKIVQSLAAISRDTTYLPASRFLEFVKAAALEPFLQQWLTTLKQDPATNQISAEEIEQLHKQIEMSATWQELENNIDPVADLLYLGNIPDEENLISYQNAIRTHVIQKLNLFFLSADNQALPKEAFMPEYRQILINILESAWIIDSDTYNFYLDEFDLKSAPMRTLKQVKDNGSL